MPYYVSKNSSKCPTRNTNALLKPSVSEDTFHLYNHLVDWAIILESENPTVLIKHQHNYIHLKRNDASKYFEHDTKKLFGLTRLFQAQESLRRDNEG